MFEENQLTLEALTYRSASVFLCKMEQFNATCVYLSMCLFSPVFWLPGGMTMQ